MNGVVWPDVPTNRAAPCDRCERDARRGSVLCETCGHEPAHDNDDSGCACGCHYSAEHHARIHAKLAVYRATGIYPTDAELLEATK